MPKFNKNILVLLFFSSSMIMALLFVNINLSLTAGGSSEPIYLHGPPLTPIHMHSNESLVPIHMNSNITLTPVHMHYVGPPEWDPIHEPWETPWHELYPEFCLDWILTSWEDFGEPFGELSPNDQIDMIDRETGNVTWYHVDRITWTLNLTSEFEERMFIEFKGPPGGDPIHFPVCTLWHEVWPSYCNVYHIIGWIDSNGNLMLDFCDFIEFDDGTIWHVEDVATDLILREKIMDPICTWWHEIHPNYCKWWHLTSWEDEGDPVGQLSPGDQIDMNSDAWYWDTFWSMGDVNRDGYINQTDADRIAAKFGWTGPPGGIPEDINSDGQVNATDVNICEHNQGLDIWTYFPDLGKKEWYHVDRVTLTLNVTSELEPTRWMKIELKTYYFEEMYNALKHPIETRWHEVYPHYSNVYMLMWWDWMEDDNCNGVLDICDYIWLLNETSGLEERYHVEDICYDIILNKKIMDPRCTYWHALYPEEEYCQEWHLTSWNDTGESFGRLSPCDQIDMNNTETGEIRWYHVDRVTLTLKVYSEMLGEMYIEFKGPFEDIYLVKIKPVSTLWHEVWPFYAMYERWHIVDWEDNCNGVLDSCDYVLLQLVDEEGYPIGDPELFHVEDLAIDLTLTEKITDPVCTYWHALYPPEEYCKWYHVTNWKDNEDGVLSPCDDVELNATKWCHVENVTLTLKVGGKYLELEIGDAPVEDALVCRTNPVNTYWHEVYPEFCGRYELTGWDDNCNGVLDYCDYVELTPVGSLVGTWYHVEEVAFDIVVKPPPVHDVAVTYVASRYPWVYQGLVDPIDVTVVNEGDFTETLDVYAFYDSNLAAPKHTVVLNSGDTASLTFSWLTTGVPPGFYTVSANATIAVDDYPANNYLSGNVQEVREWPAPAEDLELYPREVVILGDPTSTQWHELHPSKSNYYHLTSWEPGNVLSPCDQIDMYAIDPPVKIYVETDFVDPLFPFDSEWWDGTYWWLLTSWEDNGDGYLSECDQIDMTNMDTGDVVWFHVQYIDPPGPEPGPRMMHLDVKYWFEVDEVTVDMLLSPVEGGPQIFVEYKCGYWTFDPENPICTKWNEIDPALGPVRCLHLSSWEDNGNGVLDPCDIIDVTPMHPNPGPVEWYHVDFMSISLKLTPKPSPPVVPPPPSGPVYLESDMSYDEFDLANPVCTYWHEIYPVYSRIWHLSSWEDGTAFSPCDKIVLRLKDAFGEPIPGTETEYHIDKLTVAMNITSMVEPIGHIVKFEGSLKQFVKYHWADPISTQWHEVNPEYCRQWHLIDWLDTDLNGLLGFGDQILMIDKHTGWIEEFHVESLSTDIIISLVGVHDVAVINVTTSKDGCIPMPFVSQGYTTRVNVTILNEGTFTENVTVTAYANLTMIGTQTFNNLAPNASTTLAFVWDTTSFAKGNYTISANATAVPGEKDLADNTMTGVDIYVGFVGDVNCDGKVRIDDVRAVAKCFGTDKGGPPNSQGYYYNTNRDINDDDKIRIDDVRWTAKHFGEGP